MCSASIFGSRTSKLQPRRRNRIELGTTMGKAGRPRIARGASGHPGTSVNKIQAGWIKLRILFFKEASFDSEALDLGTAGIWPGNPGPSGRRSERRFSQRGETRPEWTLGKL